MGRQANSSSDEEKLSVSKEDLAKYKRELGFFLADEIHYTEMPVLEFSKQAGVSFPTIRKITYYGLNIDKKDDDYTYSFSNAVKIAYALGLPLSILNYPFSLPPVPPPIVVEVDGDTLVLGKPREEEDGGMLVIDKLREIDEKLPEKDYYSRIITLYHYLSDKQKKAVVDLINCYFA